MTNSPVILEAMNTALTRFRPLIPAGGVGSRLWPLSRAHAPKFLLDLTSSGNSLLRDTYDRLIDLSNGSVMVVTGTSHANAVTQQIPELRAADLVLEPSPKDSAAAIGLACAIIHRREPDAIIGSFAADHVISPVDEFHRVVTEAVITAATGKIVTIGITPTEPSSAFGYIHAGASLGIEDAPNAHAVDTFVEKPDTATAQKYLDSGEYTWNGDVAMVPGSFSWDDVGDFDAVARLNSEKSGEQLTILGEKDNVINHGCSGIVVANTDRKISIIGLNDIVVVDTPDALLVAPRSKAQAVKDAVGEIKARGLNNLL